MTANLFLKDVLQQYQHAQPTVFHDVDWPSPCEQGDVLPSGEIAWHAVAREGESLLTLASALELSFPEELNLFYSSFYAPNIQAQFDGHHVELIQPWSHDDFERLQENITGHVLMKRRLRQPETVFIGLTEQDDILITVDVKTGEVCLEQLGKKPHHVLAPSIGEFLKRVTV